MGIAHERIFRRDPEIDLRVGGRPLTLYCVHLKLWQPAQRHLRPRAYDAGAHRRAAGGRRIIEERFGTAAAGASADHLRRFHDYAERIVITGDSSSGFHFQPVKEAQSSLDVLLADGLPSTPR